MRKRRCEWDVVGVGIAAVVGLLSAGASANLHHLATSLMILPLLVVVELFPIRFRKLEFVGSFPILYTMAITAGYPDTALMSGIVLWALNTCQRKPLRTVVWNCSNRVISLVGTGFALNAIQLWMPIRSSQYFLFYFTNLFLSALFVSLFFSLIMLIALRHESEHRVYRRLLINGMVINVLVALLYDGFMIWLAKNPNNTASGPLGTLFFFLPLPAFTIVLHLITNLTRAKRGLETLFAVSQSINQQSDLPMVLHHVIQEAKQLVQSTFARLYVVNEDHSFDVYEDTLHEPVTPRKWPAALGLSCLIVRSGEPLLIHDVHRDTRCLPAEIGEGTRSMLWIPIQIDGKAAGVISLGRKDTFGYRQDDVKLMSIYATHAGAAMKNAFYIQERERRLILEERNRLAREMHDGLAQNLAGTIFQIEMMKRNHGEQTTDALHRLQTILVETVSTVRESIYALRPQPYTHVGLVPAIRAHLDDISARHGLNTHVDISPEDCTWPHDVTKTLFAVFTESVQNSVKHAGATDLSVVIRDLQAVVTLQVMDNGIGFHFGEAMRDAVNRKSFGIDNMHRLADGVNGSLEITTSLNKGTVVLLEIPLVEESVYDDWRATL